MARKKQTENMKPKKKKGWLIALIVALVLIWAVIIGCVIYLESLLGMINKADDEVLETMSDAQYQAMMEAIQETVPEDFVGEVMNAEDVQWDEATEDLEQSDDIINLLLVGQDRRSGEGRSRTDTIILLTVNKPAKTLTLTSFMRDMYVTIPGRDDNRINVPYLLGGTDLLDATLKRNFGVNVDGNVVVDFYGFIDLVDLMGGVDIELTAKEADYMNRNFSWDVEDGMEDPWNLTEGLQHLNGSQALAYARMRKVGNSDYERTERQRRVVSQLIEKAKSLSVAELNLLMQHALPMITTDLEDGEILSYALELFPLLKDLQIQTLRIPVDGGYESKMIDGMAVLVPDLWYNRVKLQQIMEIPES